MYIKISRFVGIFLFAAAIWGHPALIAAGLPQATQASAQYGDCEASPVGDAIVTASIGDASTLIPILASDSSSAEICGLVYNGLIRYDKDLNLEGELAESWEIKDEGLVIIFHLRKGVKWHDGEPFTARDVEFTYLKLIDPNVKTPYSGDFERVKSLEVLDDHTVKVTYKEPFSPGLSSWGMGIMPRHLLEKEDLGSTKYSRNPVGTGPYRFKEWKTGEKIVLTSNPDYYEGRPFINRYIYRIIPDQATTFLELQTQGVDQIGLTPLQYSRQTDTPFFRKNYRKYRYPSFGYTYMGLNLRDAKFSDARVRLALDHAIDKDEIITGVLLGLGRISTGPFPPESWACNKDIKPVPYDPAKAKELLKEAGWEDHDGDGILDKNGQKFRFTIMTNQGNDPRKTASEIIQRRLKDVGIEAEVRIIEWATFLSEFIDKGKFEAVIMGWSLSRDPDCYDIWHSSKTRPGEFNFIGYKNEEVDRLLLEGRREYSQEKRREIYNRINRLIFDDHPYIFLFVPDALPIVHGRFKGIVPAPAGIGYNFIKWYVPKEEQRYTRW
ncbi:MAG: peptide-binding protein [Candidatus Omnitrophica bacterium]|nr:peptide-binding protein [Candidatus Omnitrophota bacterium]